MGEGWPSIGGTWNLDVAGWCSELTLDDPLCDPSTSTPRPLDVGLYTAYVKGLDVPSTPRPLDPSTYPSTPLEAPDHLVTLEPPSTPRPSNPSTTPRRTPRPLDGQGSSHVQHVACSMLIEPKMSSGGRRAAEKSSCEHTYKMPGLRPRRAPPPIRVSRFPKLGRRATVACVQ